MKQTHLLGALASALALGLAAEPVRAQGFDSGSDGSDGALTFPAGAVTFDPQVLGLDADGDGVYEFTTIDVPAGTTVRLSASVLGEGKPVVWLATGDVTISGILDLDGRDGHAQTGPALPSDAGAGGYDGGTGLRADSPTTPGNGPGGAAVNVGSLGLGGAHRSVYGNRFLLPLTGGSGGSGADTVGAAPGGGAGGGALLIASSTRIAIGGEINARGGIGWSGSGTGGCGAGGGVRLVAPTCTGGGIVRVNGGINPGNSRVGDAESGRVRIEAFSHQFTNTEGNVTSFARPGLVFLPPNAPKVRVVSVVTAEGTIAIPPGATASYEMPDAVVNTTTPVTLNVAAENIPLGTTVTLRMVSETGALSVVTSGPLSGTTASSTATAGPFTLPTGFSRFSLAVSFAPQ